jgi:hypothetical protein
VGKLWRIWWSNSSPLNCGINWFRYEWRRNCCQAAQCSPIVSLSRGATAATTINRARSNSAEPQNRES